VLLRQALQLCRHLGVLGRDQAIHGPLDGGEINLGHFPDDLPVETEVGVHCVVAKAPDLTPRKLGQFFSDVVGDARSCLPDDEELAKHSVLEDLVRRPVAIPSVDPAEHSSGGDNDVGEE
jgi:hypothetical protein